MRAILASIAIASAAAACVADAQAFQGRYTVLGMNLDGSTYRGQAQITQTSPNTCRITWSAGGVSEGVCMRNANAFTAAYSLKGKVGLVIYQVMQDGSMQGLWTLADTQGVGRETLVPVR